ncbi:hypothetical protein BTVI_13681 [Pitangus sulphuratus]|nr:hypothetical protein BTVI_13681 [Pitangus sulphuratus]
MEKDELAAQRETQLDKTAWVEKLSAEVHHVGAHVPKSWATKEHHNNGHVNWAAKIEVCQVDLDWQHKGELFLAQRAQDTSGQQGRDARDKGAQDRGEVSQVIHDCEICTAIKQAKQIKPLWNGG